MNTLTDPDLLFAEHRAKINSLNLQLLNLLAQRQEVCIDVGRIKAENGIAVMQPARVKAVLDQCVENAEPLGLRPHYIRDLFQKIIFEACELEELFNQPDNAVEALVTLGPSGTNHEWIAKQYLKETGRHAEVLLVDSFNEALQAWKLQRAKMILICAAHPDYANLIAACVTDANLKPAESFIRSSQPLAVLTSANIDEPHTIAIHPATREYTDLSAWKSIVEVQSTVAAIEGVINGEWHSAIGPLALAHQHDSTLRIERKLGAPEDVWVILR